jgi:ABC-type molybdate transport system substrate-binding protein
MPIQSANSEKKIEVACAGAVRQIINELAHAFMLTASSKVSLKFDRSNVVKTRVIAGEIVDVAAPGG